MALTPNFTSQESLASNNLVTFTDTSTGSDGTITTRQIYIQLADGTYLVPAGTSTSYISWAYSNSSITVDILSQSTAASVTVKWLAGSSVVYTKTIVMCWDLYDYMFDLQLMANQTADPSIIQDTNYYSNWFRFLTNTWNAENAITAGSDIYSAQNLLNKNTYMIQNESKYF